MLQARAKASRMSINTLEEEPTSDLAAWMNSVQQDMESALQACLPLSEPKRLSEAMHYVTLGGGKRIRPLLCFAAGEMCQAPTEALTSVALAVELIHTYSLVHDDLPCMDDDKLRRGRPTCHMQYDEATALLVGDSLQSLAFEVLARQQIVDPELQLSLITQLARASGSLGMAGGQAVDLQNVGQPLDTPMLEYMHSKKTGALISSAIMMGAACGDLLAESEKQCLQHFSRQLGLLFQVIDDILDYTSASETLGKTAGKDQAANKPTFVSAMGLATTRQYASDLHDDAIRSLSCFGHAATRLQALTDYVYIRKY